MTRRRRLVAGWAGAGALLTLPLLVALVLLIAAPVALADGAWVYQGSFGSTGSGAGQFGTDVGNIAYDGHGVLYIADHDNDRIEQWTTAGSYIQSWGTGGSGDGLLDEPFGFALDHNGDCYITDEYDGSVQKFDVAGNWVATLAVGSSVSLGVAVDSSGGTWVSDSSGSNVYKFDADGNQLFKVDTSESGPLDTPTGIACDSAGNAYIADSGNGRVVVFSQYGQFLRQWQTAYEPWSIAVDSAGHVFVGERSLFDASEAIFIF